MFSGNVQLGHSDLNWQFFYFKVSTFLRLTNPFGTRSIFLMGNEIAACLHVEKVLLGVTLG